MPFVNIKMVRAEASVEQKRALVEGITQLLVDVLGKNPEKTHIAIEEFEPENWGHAGTLISDR